MRSLQNRLAALALMLASGSALAHNCPNEMRAIDDKLATKPVLSVTDATNVAQLRASAAELHKAGRHDQAMEALKQAKAILGL